MADSNHDTFGAFESLSLVHSRHENTLLHGERLFRSGKLRHHLQHRWVPERGIWECWPALSHLHQRWKTLLYRLHQRGPKSLPWIFWTLRWTCTACFWRLAFTCQWLYDIPPLLFEGLRTKFKTNKDCFVAIDIENLEKGRHLDEVLAIERAILGVYQRQFL